MPGPEDTSRDPCGYIREFGRMLYDSNERRSTEFSGLAVSSENEDVASRARFELVRVQLSAACSVSGIAEGYCKEGKPKMSSSRPCGERASLFETISVGSKPFSVFCFE